MERQPRPSPLAGSPVRPDTVDMSHGPEADAPGTATPPVVLLMNHGRDPMGELSDALARSGYIVHVADCLTQSHRLLRELRPETVLLNPLVLCQDGVELELLTSLQREEDPVPVILLVDDLRILSEARSLRVPFRDFVLKPCSPAECVYRVDLAMQTRQQIGRAHV